MMKLQTSSGRQKMPATLALALAALCVAGVFTAGPAEAHQNKWNNGGHGHKWRHDDGYNYGGYNSGYYYYPQPYVQYVPQPVYVPPPPVYYAPPPPVYYAPPPPVYYAPPPLFSVIIPLRID